MARLAYRDVIRAQELSRDILTLDTGRRPLVTYIMPRLREYLEAEGIGSYGITRDENGFFDMTAFQWDGAAGSAKKLAPVMGSVIRSTPNAWGMFDPAAPEQGQRNKVFVLDYRKFVNGPPSREQAVAAKVYAECDTYKTDIGRDFQMRALVCDGPSLLAWVGTLQQDRPTERQRLLLNALIPAFRERLVTERQLGGGTLMQNAFVAALDSIPSPAFLATRLGYIVHANAAGRMRSSADTSGTADAIRGAIANLAPGRVTKVETIGCKEQFLVVLNNLGDALLARLARAKHYWGLTRRQTEVLTLLARGQTNQAIAASFQCTVRTIEAHVSALLKKVDVHNRAELIAQFWTLSA